MFSTDHLHPLIVHFPIALITAGFFAEAASLFFKSEKCLSKTGFIEEYWSITSCWGYEYHTNGIVISLHLK